MAPPELETERETSVTVASKENIQSSLVQYFYGLEAGTQFV